MQNHPAWPGPPRLAHLPGLIHGAEIAPLLVAHPILGRLNLGEPGDPRPIAACRSDFDDGSAFIVVSGGMLDFLHAVLGTLMTGARVTVTGGASHAAARRPIAVDRALAATYASWGPRWNGQRIPCSLPPLPDATQRILDGLWDAARLFLLLHECAHAALHAGIAPAERTPAQEFEADAFALRTTLLGFGMRRGKVRASLAGAFLVVRALSALAILGHQFPDTHPPPAARLAAMEALFAELCGDDFTAAYFATVAVAQDQRMEAAERRLLGLAPAQPAVTAARIVSMLMSALIELAQEPPRVEEAAVLRDLRALCRAAPAEELAEAGRLARRVFLAPPSGAETTETIRIRARYPALIARLPRALRATFQAAIEE